MRKHIHHHWKTMMSRTPEPVSRPQMLLCGMAVGFPLFAGLYTNNLILAIYGALTGYLLTFSEQSGTLRHRLSVLTLTFVMLIAGFALGLFLQHRPTEFLFALAVLAYWIGLLGGEGADLERALLFSTLQVIVVVHTPALSLEHALPILCFALTGFAFAVAATISQVWLTRPSAPRPPGFFSTLKYPLETKLDRHLHSVSYVTITLLAALLVHHYEIERGYWMVLAVLIVMKPGRVLSIYRSFQQFFGTLLAVGLAELIIYFFHTPLPLILLVMLCAACVPWAIKRNYWLVAFLVTIIVLLLLDMPFVEKGDFHTPILRLRATAYGCLLGIAGAMLSWLLSRAVATARRRSP